MTEKNPIEYLSIGTKNLTSGSDYDVRVYSVLAASKQFSNEYLAELIQSERDRILGQDEKERDNSPDIRWIVVIVVTVAVTVVVMIMVSRSKKNTRPEDRV